MIQALLLVNNQILISQVYQVDADPGEPNCRLVDPYLFTLGGTSPGFRLTPWMGDVTDDNYAMIHPERIVTIREPKLEVLNHYKKLIFIDEDSLTVEDVENISSTKIVNSKVKDEEAQVD
jgi:hypothetical protein